MAPTGLHFLGGHGEVGEGPTFAGADAITGAELAPAYHEASPSQIDRACVLAAEASAPFAAVEPAQRAALLRAIADGLLGLGDELVQRVTAETALPAARVQGERARTVLQLQQFAALIENGAWVDARIDRGDAARQPQPRPDLRRMLVPLGPVAVFGASNFPLAYSVVGGDTASALAAGCPVIVKAHPAHPGTSELVGGIVVTALRTLGLPAGTFALLHGRSHETGARLVQHAAIAAVGFTGSHQGGRALFDLAARRTVPIPVFAEMGSTNPVVVLPQAMTQRGSRIAASIADSALLAQGQFCTSPGLVLCIEGPGVAGFREGLRSRLQGAAAGPTVHRTIRAGYERALAEVAPLLSPPPPPRTGTSNPSVAVTAVCPTLLEASAAAVVQHARLRTEIYGPAVLLVSCRDADELRAVIRSLPGNLTATVHGEAIDFEQHAAVCTALRDRVGRLIANGVPTGVEVTAAMVHGGPYPASTDARFTAVGTTSIQRWVRPACWQDWPEAQLPPELRDDNPRRIRRLVDGQPG